MYICNNYGQMANSQLSVVGIKEDFAAICGEIQAFELVSYLHLIKQGVPLHWQIQCSTGCEEVSENLSLTNNPEAVRSASPCQICKGYIKLITFSGF